MNKENELKIIIDNIKNRLAQLESYAWDVYVEPGYSGESTFDDYERSDKDTWLHFGTRQLYYWISLFIEMKNYPLYLSMFTSKFGSYIDDSKRVKKVHDPFSAESDPSMIILDEFREFLSAFSEFSAYEKIRTNKLLSILSHTNAMLLKTNTTITNETSIYDVMKWFIEIVYPRTLRLKKARFSDKFTHYEPDILVPEISCAVEYKYVRTGQNISTYLNQLKNDAENYKGDVNYRFFYAVVYFQDKTDLNQEAFKVGVAEKGFPDNWMIIAV